MKISTRFAYQNAYHLWQIVDPMTPNPKKTQRNARPNWIQSAPGARAAPGARTAAAAGQVAGGGRGAVSRSARSTVYGTALAPSRPPDPAATAATQRPAPLLRGRGRDVGGRKASSPPAARSPSPRPALRASVNVTGPSITSAKVRWPALLRRPPAGPPPAPGCPPSPRWALAICHVRTNWEPKLEVRRGHWVNNLP